jgi:PAS domain S-box-containing protein
MNARLRSSVVIWLVQVVGLSLACYVVGRLGGTPRLTASDSVSLWTPSGVALGGLLVLGYRVWPAIWFGSFFVYLTTAVQSSDPQTTTGWLAIAATFGLGAVLQAVTATWLVRRVLGATPTFDDLKHVLVVTVLAGFVSTALGASVDAACLAGAARERMYGTAWQISWRAELTGVVVFAPLVLILAEAGRRAFSRPRPFRIIEFNILFIALPIVVFALTDDQGTVYGSILVIASLLWATLRFGKVGTAIGLLTIAFMLASNVSNGSALLGTIRVKKSTRALNAQTLLDSMAMTFWILAAVLNERELVAKDLRDNEARFRQFSEGMPHIIWMTTPDRQRVLYVNRSFERIFGRKREDVYAASDVWLDGIHPEDRQLVVDARLQGEATGEYCTEFRVIHPDGAVRWLRDRAVPVRDDRGNKYMLAGIAEDITLSRQIAEKLARQQSELLHVSRLSSVGQMVATLSHEVAQPMSAIGTFATLCAKHLQSEDFDEADRLNSLKQCIDAISSENQRCRAILRRLRDYSRKAPRQQALCDLNAVLSESIDLLSIELRRSGVKVRCELAPSLPLVIADRIRLQQVVVNLLTNARDAMLNVDPSRRLIILRTAIEGAAITAEIEDHGVGFPVGTVDRLFEPFFSTKEDGMGLGLSICKTILDEHGGEIRALTNEHGGATFRIVLPVTERQTDNRKMPIPSG